MSLRLSSIDRKLPLLMLALAVAMSAVFATAAHWQFSRALHDSTGERLRGNARLLAGMLGDGLAAARTQLGEIARAPVVRDILLDTLVPVSRADSQAFAAVLPRGAADSLRIRYRLLDRAGGIRLDLRRGSRAPAPGWAEQEAAAGRLAQSGLTLSPILAVGTTPQYEVVLPVHADRGGERLAGYFVETRVVVGQGVGTIRELVGSAELLVGQPGAGYWTDLERVVAEPPEFGAVDSVVVFDASTRGPGIGIAQPLRGTPWVVWLQQSRSAVLAPVNDFLRRTLPLALGVGAIGGLLAFVLSRRITRRLSRLTAEVDRRERRGPVPPVEVPRGRDEIDELEVAFREMSSRADRQQQLEEQLRQAQKLEAVGRLAGGIAHDFNNVLTVVVNYGEIVQAGLPPDSEPARDMAQVLHAAERAGRLTRQLLAFSRRQVLQPVPLDLNEAVRGAHRMLERLLPSHVRIEHRLAESLDVVLADPGQVEQVILNLAINASDAMPDGGILTFQTAMAELEDLEGATGSAPAPPRAYVSLIVRDTGHGMDRETAARVFDPFFTTKAKGKGTGLGLASVHGIVTQLGGRIWLYSEPGKGTTFKIYLPASRDASAAPPIAIDPGTPWRGEGLVLLVEDDETTREVTRRLLTAHGFSVETAPDGSSAIEYLARLDSPPRLVLSDVMMPGMTGVDLAVHLGERWPGLPMILMSGYAEGDVLTRMPRGTRRVLVEKPFTSATLLSAIRSALEPH